jgi:hypothetical protein
MVVYAKEMSARTKGIRNAAFKMIDVGEHFDTDERRETLVNIILVMIRILCPDGIKSVNT